MRNPGPTVDMQGTGAVVLAAGLSRRMGAPKMLLPWGERTVIGQVIHTLAHAGVTDIVVVTGGAREGVEAALANTPARTVFNPQHAGAEMLVSLQTGIPALREETQALFIVLGDQPLIETAVIHAVAAAYRARGAKIVIPSYQMRRGHPWLVDSSLWADLLALTEEQTMRDFLQLHQEEIEYVTVDSPGILKDMDTPEDYRSQKPGL